MKLKHGAISAIRTPGLLHTALSIALVMLLAAFSLNARQPPPPTVAEVAPQGGRQAPTGAKTLAGDERPDENARPSPLSEPNRPVTGASTGPEQGPPRSGGDEGGNGAGDGDTPGGSGPAGVPGGGGPGGNVPEGTPDRPGATSTSTVLTPTATTPTTTSSPRQIQPDSASPTTSVPGPTTTAGSGPTTTAGPGPTTTAGPPSTSTTLPTPNTTTTLPPPTTSTTVPAPTTTSTTLPTTTTTLGPRVSVQCTGGGNQIAEDPQSPPCISEGPDAGTNDSSPGIKNAVIKIVYPGNIQFGMGNNTGEIAKVWTAMETFINNHFMLYGRKIALVPYQMKSSPPNGNPVLARADADAVADMGAFAAVGFLYDIAGQDFFDRLAERGVISATGITPSVEESHYSEAGRHPYQWSYTPTLAQMERSAAEFTCNQLKGNPPIYAGDPVSAGINGGIDRDQPRKFGLIVSKFIGSDTSTAALEETLRDRCGLVIGADARIDSLYTGGSFPAETAAAVARMEAAKVTTIICICHANPFRLGFQRAAEQRAYRPEWFVTTFMHNDFQSTLSFAQFDDNPTPTERPEGPRNQMAHTFGLSFRPKPLPVDQLPITRIVKEGYGLATDGSSFNWTLINKDKNAGYPPEWSGQFYNWVWYKPLLLLASGIQMAGPKLTPQTFAAGEPGTPYPGLQGTTFPNPDTGEYAGRVGFTGDHTMVDDATVIWWSWDHDAESVWGRTVQRVDNRPIHHEGTWCYADRGRRRTLGEVNEPPPNVFTGPGSACY